MVRSAWIGVNPTILKHISFQFRRNRPIQAILTRLKLLYMGINYAETLFGSSSPSHISDGVQPYAQLLFTPTQYMSLVSSTDTVGCTPMTDFGTLECRRSSRRYSRQYSNSVLHRMPPLESSGHVEKSILTVASCPLYRSQHEQ